MKAILFIFIILLTACASHKTEPSVSKLNLRFTQDGDPIFGYNFNSKSKQALASDERNDRRNYDSYDFTKSDLNDL